MNSHPKANVPEIRSDGRRRVVRVGLVMLAVAVVGGILFWFDPAKGGFFPVCRFHQLTGLNCPGCGGLRALHHLAHGEILSAFRCNPLLLVLLPIFGFVGLRWVLRGNQAVAGGSWFVRPGALWSLLVVTVLFAILRNLPGPAFAWMSP